MSGFRCKPCGNEFQNTNALLNHKKEKSHWQYFGLTFKQPDDYKSGLSLVGTFLDDLQKLLRTYLEDLRHTKFAGLVEICNEILYFSRSEGFDQMDFVKMDIDELVNSVKSKRINWISIRDRNKIKTELLELLVEINLVQNELNQN